MACSDLQYDSVCAATGAIYLQIWFAGEWQRRTNYLQKLVGNAENFPDDFYFSVWNFVSLSLVLKTF